jgi:hypothetical protein
MGEGRRIAVKIAKKKKVSAALGRLHVAKALTVAELSKVSECIHTIVISGRK